MARAAAAGRAWLFRAHLGDVMRNDNEISVAPRLEGPAAPAIQNLRQGCFFCIWIQGTTFGTGHRMPTRGEYAPTNFACRPHHAFILSFISDAHIDS